MNNRSILYLTMNKHTPCKQNDSEKSKRAKARWAILRHALLNNVNTRTNKNANAITAIKQKTKDEASAGREEYKKASNEENKYSIHRFHGFQLFDRTILDMHNDEGIMNATVKNAAGDDDGSYKYEFIEYKIPIENGNDNHTDRQERQFVKVRTREKTRQKKKVNIKDLMSHVYYGVDNTGNTRVWECSTILAHIVTKSKSTDSSPDVDRPNAHPSPFIGLSNMLSLARTVQMKDLRCSFHTKHDCETTYMKTRKRLRIIELGAGMAALPSLSLAAVALATFNTNDSSHNSQRNADVIPYMDIFITDGHPKCVENNSICSKLTLDLYNTNEKETEIKTEIDAEEKSNMHDGGNESFDISSQCCSVQTHQLLWKTDVEGSKECESLLLNGKRSYDENDKDYFDLVLVSDCTHFTEFHAGLTVTIGRLLRVDGICILCQPKRGKSLDQFIQMIHVINTNKNTQGDDCKPLFDVKLYHDFDETISNQHTKLLDRSDKVYDEDIHYPLILILKKLRQFNEETDTAMTMQHVKEREK